MKKSNLAFLICFLIMAQIARGEETLKSLTEKFLDNAKLKGFIFTRYSTIDGANGQGRAWQQRIKFDITTGKVDGYSITGGLFFSQGSSAIDKDRRTHGDVQGSRAVAFNNNFADRFNIAQLYVSKEIGQDSLKGKLDIGRMNLISPLTNKSLDIGIGGVLRVTHKLQSEGELSYNIAVFDSWMTDHINYNIRRRTPQRDNTAIADQEAAAVGIGNNLSMLHISGENIAGGLHFNLLYANIWNLFDFMTLGDIGYRFKFGSHTIGFLTQVAYAGMNKNPNMLLGKRGKAAQSNLAKEIENGLSAQYRGIYNVQLNYKSKSLSAKIGFLKSFAQGYAVILANNSGINTAGKFWNGNMTNTYDGLGIFGSGSFKDSSIGVAYLAMAYKITPRFNLGLDISYLFGDNHFPVLNVIKPSKSPFNPSINNIDSGIKNFINARFAEIAPSITYMIVKNVDLIFTSAFFTGEINFIKTRTQLRLNF